jgi:hypothetical protein
MGKYVLLLTFSVALALAYFSQQSRQTSAAANEDQVERQKTVLARQIARSAFEQGISQVRRVARNVDQWPPEDEDFPPREPKEYEEGGGTYEIDYQPQSGEGTVIVSAWGKYGDTDVVEYRINGVVSQKGGARFNGITIDGSVSSADLSGNTRVFGNDAGSGEDRHAISVTEEAGKEKIRGECGRRGGGAKEENIRGVDGDCDIVRQDIDLSEINKKLENMEDENDNGEKICEGPGNTSIGSTSNPVFAKIKDECTMDGSKSGTGILYVDNEDEEEFFMTGNSAWDGLVFIGGEEEQETPSFKMARGNARINGALNLFGSSKIDMSGNTEVQYNSDMLKNVLQEFNIEFSKEGGGSEIALTDTCGGIAPADGSFDNDHPCSDGEN